ncbi:uncharacterized protein LOC143858819 [Tasmannia lanceolata]|uniref:uncharacterized protein LOC143858819 n=1 Tax=Tasmannia lanceolata TaxID=3420 RepID=UPI004062BCA7
MPDDQAKRANAAKVEGNMLLVCKTNEPDVEHGNTWYLDTGCNNHMCGTKELCSHLDETVRGEVNFGNKSKVFVMDKGNINIQSREGTNVTITDVYFVPGLFWNLLSVEQLSEKGHKIDIQNGVCAVKGRKNKMVAKVQMRKNQLFPLTLQTKTVMNLSIMLKDRDWLWHLWFGHLNFHGLRLLV